MRRSVVGFTLGRWVNRGAAGTNRGVAMELEAVAVGVHRVSARYHCRCGHPWKSLELRRPRASIAARVSGLLWVGVALSVVVAMPWDRVDNDRCCSWQRTGERRLVYDAMGCLLVIAAVIVVIAAAAIAARLMAKDHLLRSVNRVKP